MQKRGLFDSIIDFLALLGGVLLVGAVLIMSVEIFMRYFFAKPLIWTVEVCEYILFTMTFLAAPWLLKKGGHVGVDILVERLNPKLQGWLGVFSSAIGVFVSAVVVWFSAAAAWNSYVNRVLITKTMTMYEFFFLALISIGYFLLMGQFARQGLQHLRRLKEVD